MQNYCKTKLEESVLHVAIGSSCLRPILQAVTLLIHHGTCFKNSWRFSCSKLCVSGLFSLLLNTYNLGTAFPIWLAVAVQRHLASINRTA